MVFRPGSGDKVTGFRTGLGVICLWTGISVVITGVLALKGNRKEITGVGEYLGQKATA